ncbi:hypothetical protein AB0I28_25485 [Phytomonospora sp. NPDC050363]|uniref:hypothetical protein n=1 Tax=Phytomonospora sp. NPDC050363 TaxID=3155642 RepID=UPI0033D063DD
MAKTYNPMPKQAKVARAFLWVQGVAVLLLTGVVAWPVVTGLGEISNFEKFLVHVLGVPAGVAVPDKVPAFVREQHWQVVAAAGVAALLWLLFGLLMRTQKRILWLLILIGEFALIVGNIAAIWVIDAPVYGAVLGLIMPIVVAGNLLARICRRWFHH